MIYITEPIAKKKILNFNISSHIIIKSRSLKSEVINFQINYKRTKYKKLTYLNIPVNFSFSEILQCFRIFNADKDEKMVLDRKVI